MEKLKKSPKFGRKRSPWGKVDWNKSNREIAAEVGWSEAAVEVERQRVEVERQRVEGDDQYQ